MVHANGDKKVTSIEGCLSLPKHRFSVERYEKIILKGKQLVGLEITIINRQYGGMEAIILQHEIDHGKNILISNIGTEVHIYT